MTEAGWVADLAIWLAYMVIGLRLVTLLPKEIRALRLMFGIFIFSCGITHLNTAWAVMHGRCDAYSVWANAWKMETALASIPAAVIFMVAANKFKSPSPK